MMMIIECWYLLDVLIIDGHKWISPQMDIYIYMHLSKSVYVQQNQENG